MKRPPHRPTQYADLSAFTEKTGKYLEAERTPTVQGWVSFMGISRMTLSNYKKRGEAWEQTILNTLQQIKQHRCEPIIESESV